MKEYKATISVPSSAAAGTYYGVVKFAGSSSAQAAVAHYIFVDVGQVTHNLELQQFSVNSPLVAMDGKASGKISARLKNIGNAYTVPEVKIEIIDSSGSAVASYDVNEKAGGVLPGMTRGFSVDVGEKNLQLSQNANYKMRVIAKFGDDKTINQETDFVVGATPEQGASGSSASGSKTPLLLGIGAAALLITVVSTLLLIKRKRAKSPVTNGPVVGAGLVDEASTSQSASVPTTHESPSGDDTQSDVNDR